jgi:trehalose/maltose hydrolase-like predicted phosphorylase
VCNAYIFTFRQVPTTSNIKNTTTAAISTSSEVPTTTDEPQTTRTTNETTRTTTQTTRNTPQTTRSTSQATRSTPQTTRNTTVEPQTSTNEPATANTVKTQTTTKDSVSLPTHRPNISSTPVPTGKKNATDPFNLTSLVEMSGRKELTAESLRNLIEMLESDVNRRNYTDTSTTRVCFIHSGLKLGLTNVHLYWLFPS